jgi:anti-sigma factor RsiW
MEITRSVILDLLPLYLAGEASPDTQAVVEQYLETDPELAEVAKLTAAMRKPEDTPVPIKKEAQMEAYREAQRRILQRTVIWGAVIAFGILSLLGLALLAYSMLVPAL